MEKENITCTCNTNPATCPIHDYIPPKRHAEFAPKRATDEYLCLNLAKASEPAYWRKVISDYGLFSPRVTYRRLKQPTAEDLGHKNCIPQIDWENLRQERDQLRAQLVDYQWSTTTLKNRDLHIVDQNKEIVELKTKLDALKLDYANLVSMSKLQTEKLTDQIQIYVGRVERLKECLTKMRDYCESDICHSSMDISNLRMMIRQALNQ